jgi:exodeoxyribonuclease-3
MRIATWNVNSVRARLPLVEAWLRREGPDVVLLQEIKCENAAFPALPFQGLGYHASVVGQKSYNGVAILSRHPLEESRTSLPGNDADNQARYVEARVQGIRIASLYVPNGNPIDSDKYPAKLDWLDRLKAHAATLLKTEEPLVFGGDFNVIPAPLDVDEPAAWEKDALYAPPTRAAFRRLTALGLTDAFRALHPTERAYTFWDYQQGAWPKNKGLRIDHFLLSPEAADRLVACDVDRAPRAEEKASDHTPLVMSLT